jgi:hypothetical protein
LGFHPKRLGFFSFLEQSKLKGEKKESITKNSDALLRSSDSVLLKVVLTLPLCPPLSTFQR